MFLGSAINTARMRIDYLHSCCPSPGGLTSREAIELTRGVASAGLVGVDVVEIGPTLDPTPATALMGNRIAMEAIAFANGCGR